MNGALRNSLTKPMARKLDIISASRRSVGSSRHVPPTAEGVSSMPGWAPMGLIGSFCGHRWPVICG
jgi:hypothetical protein